MLFRLLLCYSFCYIHTMDDKIKFFENMIQCCFPVAFWEFDNNLALLSSLNENNEMMHYFFKYSHACNMTQQYIQNNTGKPALIRSDGLCWTADYIAKEKKLCLMGPFAMTKSAMRHIRQKYQEENYSFKRQNQINHTLNRIPLIPASYIFQYTIMFHYALTGEKIRISDIQHPFTEKEDTFFPDDNKDSRRHNGVWVAEINLIQAIQNGNLNYKSYLNNAALLSSGIHTRDPGSLRSLKDSIILFSGLCTRAAISGGVPAETAYDMCDIYTDMIESADSVSELNHISDEMVDDCVRSVRQYQSPVQSRIVNRCCDYIRMHITEKITLQTLSKACGYSTYYLSRKFKEEVRVPLGEYVLHAKLDQACFLLKTTSNTIQDISDSLSFSSRSYFSTAFQRYKGVSPQKYRQQNQL